MALEIKDWLQLKQVKRRKTHTLSVTCKDLLIEKLKGLENRDVRNTVSLD